MKRLSCEVCGSNDLIKQDGVFVCEACGCKYSLDEVRKMMVEGTVEVTGTVKVDNTASVANYLDIAKSAIKSDNYEEAEEYCKKILELDISAWEAWHIRGTAVGWQSSGENSRLPEMANYYSRALKTCPEEQYNKLKEACENEIRAVSETSISYRLNLLRINPSAFDSTKLKYDINMIDKHTNAFLREINAYHGDEENLKYALLITNDVSSLWDRIYSTYDNANGGYPLYIQWQEFINAGDALIRCDQIAIDLLGTKYDYQVTNDLIIDTYKQMIKWEQIIKDSCSWTINIGGWTDYAKDYTLTEEAKEFRYQRIEQIRNTIKNIESLGPERIAVRVEKEKEEKEKRIQEYWNDHSEERKELDDEKAKLMERGRDLELQVKATEEFITVRKLEREVSKTEEEIDNTGILKIKERKALREKQDDLLGQLKEAKARFKKIARPFDEELDKVTRRIEEINRRINLE